MESIEKICLFYECRGIDGCSILQRGSAFATLRFLTHSMEVKCDQKRFDRNRRFPCFQEPLSQTRPRIMVYQSRNLPVKQSGKNSRPSKTREISRRLPAMFEDPESRVNSPFARGNRPPLAETPLPKNPCRNPGLWKRTQPYSVPNLPSRRKLWPGPPRRFGNSPDGRF